MFLPTLLLHLLLLQPPQCLHLLLYLHLNLLQLLNQSFISDLLDFLLDLRNRLRRILNSLLRVFYLHFFTSLNKFLRLSLFLHFFYSLMSSFHSSYKIIITLFDSPFNLCFIFLFLFCCKKIRVLFVFFKKLKSNFFVILNRF